MNPSKEDPGLTFLPESPSIPFNDSTRCLYRFANADLLPQLSEISPSIDLRQFLARLLTLVTKGRVSPRRASVLAYITNQLLHSHPRARH
jgi:hypothetical protein